MKIKTVNGKEFIGEIELLSISNVALEEYRKNAKHDADLPVAVLRRRFTAMIRNGKYLGTASNRKVYLFGSFLLSVNTKTSKIDVVGWRTDNHFGKVDLDTIKSLREDYLALGLTLDGNALAEVEFQAEAI